MGIQVAPPLEISRLDVNAGCGDVSGMPDQLQPQPFDRVHEREPINKWMWLLLGASLIFSVGVILQMVERQRKKANQTSAVCSLMGIGMCLFEFESEYGRFPDTMTAMELKRKTGSSLTLSDKTSNDVFVQMLVSGVATTESMFSGCAGGIWKPDGNWSSDATALAHGETGFAYVSGLSSKGNPSIPIVFGPIIPGTKTLDVKAFDGKAVILKLDNSVTSVPIDASGKIMYLGQDLLDPGNPIWNGKAPDVRWPK
ncbi:MAG: hypothetical protein ABIS50_07275 [Luteolibacter sp.]|uniref:hypothetical protein n=1 Tax=Luteolibacter sp. TaxID=1962973 RepID=UPI0032654FE3